MNATVLSGAVVGEGSLVAAGALVPQGAVIPPRSLVAGVPGRVVRELRDSDREAVRHNAEIYLDYTHHHRSATRG
jgi:carbonic anhydrase/acetyltransferase-like protein (isoleucine patch superfamily)